MAKKQFTMEDNFDKIAEKVKESHRYALNIIGRELVKEIRPNVKRMYPGTRNKFLQSTLQSWARKKEGDLIIGFKDPKKIKFLAHVEGLEDYKWEYDAVDDPIKPVVVKNIDRIHQLVGEAMMAKTSKKAENNMFRNIDLDA